MSLLRVIERTAIGGAIRLVRLPFDSGIRLLGNTEVAGPAASATLSIDRADAAVRTIAGVLLADGELREDARRRSIAADERERALRLRDEAGEAGDRREYRKEQAQKTEARRKETAQKQAAEREKDIEERAKRARLEQLDKKSEAVEEKQEAITAADEAQRLSKAAARAKAARKANGSTARKTNGSPASKPTPSRPVTKR